MQIGAIIPIHSFVKQVPTTVSWCKENYPKLFANHKIVIVSDSKQPGIAKLFSALSNLSSVECVYSNRKNSLKSSIITALKLLEGCDVINIIEADAIPNFQTLAALLEAYEELDKVGAIGPMFEWNNKSCYPTHRHWYKDPLISENLLRVGKVREVGKPGIPFLFSLWNPKALKLMEQRKEELPEVYFLDSGMGKILNENFRIYRLTDHSIQHINGGKNK